MNKKQLGDTYYLIVKYWLGVFDGLVKIGNDKEEIIKLFKDKYMTTNEHNFGITEEGFELIEAKVILKGE